MRVKTAEGASLFRPTLADGGDDADGRVSVPQSIFQVSALSWTAATSDCFEVRDFK